MSLTGALAIRAPRSRYTEAEPLSLQTLEMQTRLLGEEHPSTLSSTTNLGVLYSTMERHEDAARMLETSLPIKRRVLGMQHRSTRVAMHYLAITYGHLGRRVEAETLGRELLALEVADAEQPGADPRALNQAAWSLLKHAIVELRDPIRGLAFAQRACAAEEAAGGANLASYLDTLAVAQHGTGDTAAAVETQRRAISLMTEGNATPEVADRLAEYEAALAKQARDD